MMRGGAWIPGLGEPGLLDARLILFEDYRENRRIGTNQTVNNVNNGINRDKCGNKSRTTQEQEWKSAFCRMIRNEITVQFTGAEAFYRKDLNNFDFACYHY